MITWNGTALRYREDMPIASDQPFTLEACFRAKRISVLADYECYYAVRRLTATNITYLSQPVERLRTAEAVLAFAAGLIPSGPARDAVLLHYFDHNVAKLVEDDLLRHDRTTQQRLYEGVGRLVTAHLSDGVSSRLGAETRIRLAVARHGVLDDLLAVIRRDAEVGVPGTVAEGGRRFARYPGFREPARKLPDSCFDVTTAADWPAKLDATSIGWGSNGHGERVLTITARSPVPDLAALGVDELTVNAGEIAARTDLLSRGPMGTTVQIRLAVSDVLVASDPTGHRRSVTARAGPSDRTSGVDQDRGVAAVRAPRVRPVPPRVHRRGLRLYAIGPVVDGSGRLMVSVVPLTPRRVAARVRGLLNRRRHPGRHNGL